MFTLTDQITRKSTHTPHSIQISFIEARQKYSSEHSTSHLNTLSVYDRRKSKMGSLGKKCEPSGTVELIVHQFGVVYRWGREVSTSSHSHAHKSHPVKFSSFIALASVFSLARFHSFLSLSLSLRHHQAHSTVVKNVHFFCTVLVKSKICWLKKKKDTHRVSEPSDESF